MFNLSTFSTDTPVFLAPMAGFTNAAMRRVCHRFGAALTYTEMVNASGVLRASDKTWHLLETFPDEGPIVAHLYGSDPAILAEAAAHGAITAEWIMLRLPHEVAPLFREWLAEHYPERAGKVMSIVQSIRGGRDNDPAFGTRFRPQGVWADLFAARFAKVAARLGLDRPAPALDCSQFRKPSRHGQLSLF